MSILGWIFFGLITGFIASRIVGAHGQGCVIDIALGLVGAVVAARCFRCSARMSSFTSA
jgi:uncharacterized membrane protein YeaQ/YmgE (transglycosylase-associated protein family)